MFRIGSALLLVFVVYSSWFALPLACAGNADWRPRIQPKVFRYDPETDAFTYRNGVFDTHHEDQPTPDLNYYGNRLRQFRFLGPKTQSGIYGAMDDYKARRQHDPIKYQYRWR